MIKKKLIQHSARLSKIFALCCLVQVGQLHAQVHATSAQNEARQIDALIEKALVKNNLIRNPLTDDYTFVRRIYLDIAGRIPTYNELQTFITRSDVNKRSELISELLNSEAYVSHFYNYWEDILRIQSRGRRTFMVSYQDWIKQSLKDNKPYDQMVRELILADGYTWDNPAAGFYLRDEGMPLDHMSNTIQVFLGTRMQCAQCHDHPFDKWTQKEYFHLAAYTSDVDSGGRRYNDSEAFKSLRKAFAAEKKQLIKQDKNNKKVKLSASPAERRVLRDLFQPLATSVRIKPSEQKLPYDYAYKDAKPNQVVEPHAPFGDSASVSLWQDKREVYANWLTSADNPRFTKVIANRLWKKVMGLGLIEPSDNLTDHTVPSNPELMTYLENLVVDSGFDLKYVLSVLFNSRTYQSEVYAGDVLPGYKYYYPGPLLTRMSAEQLWDSILTLAVEDLDSLKDDYRTEFFRNKEKELEAHVHNVNQLSGRELLAIVKQAGQREKQLIAQEKQLQQALKQATDKKEKSKLRKAYNKLRNEKRNALTAALTEAAGAKAADVYTTDMAMADNLVDEAAKRNKGKRKGKKAFWENLVRASEIVSPAPAGHFLHEFGQSRRELIENSHQQASIPQALSLLNGYLVTVIQDKDAPLTKTLKANSDLKTQIDSLFLSMYARLPTQAEQALFSEQLNVNNRYKAYRQVILAMLNSNEFRFIQ